MTEKLAWSCDESDRKECRNAHGCHCQEITHLLARKSATRAREHLAQVIYAEASRVHGMRKCLKIADAIIAAERRGIGTS